MVLEPHRAIEATSFAWSRSVRKPWGCQCSQDGATRNQGLHSRRSAVPSHELREPAETCRVPVRQRFGPSCGRWPGTPQAEGLSREAYEMPSDAADVSNRGKPTDGVLRNGLR